MKHILFAITALAFVFCTNRVTAQERISVTTDRPIYMAGEQMEIAVQVDGPNQLPSASRVAYVEVTDPYRVLAQQMLWLHEGQGQGSLELPLNAYSAYFQLNVYTTELLSRGQVHRELLPIVNPYHLSAMDRIKLEKSDEPLPDGIQIINSPTRPSSFVQPLDTARYAACRGGLLPEREGLFLYATAPADADIDQAFLSIRGKAIHLFEATQLRDTLFRFHVHDVSGRQNIVLTAPSDRTEGIGKFRLLCPFAQILAGSDLPMLEVECCDSLLRQRLLCSQRQQIERRSRPIEEEPFNIHFFGQQPANFYDLDEWRRFMTVDLILTEFVRGIERREHRGRTYLYTVDPDWNRYTQWPAQVLLDGVPITDIDQLMNYDARRIKYLSVYPGRYRLGHSLFQGVISMVTFEGNLPAFRLNSDNISMTFEFPL